MAIYSDLENYYQILDFHPTHSQLLIRSLKNKNRSFNIDVLFKVVKFISIPQSFNGFEVSVFDLSNINLMNNLPFKISRYSKVYVVKDKMEQEFYIDSLSFGVFHNQLDILETSIGRYDWGTLGEKILWHKQE